MAKISLFVVLRLLNITSYQFRGRVPKPLQPDRKVWLIGSAWAIGAKLVVPLWGQGKLSLTMRPPSTV